MVEGTSTESLALDVARECALPPSILHRASSLYQARARGCLYRVTRRGFCKDIEHCYNPKPKPNMLICCLGRAGADAAPCWCQPGASGGARGEGWRPERAQRGGRSGRAA